jgi:hypothetical protein
MRKILLFFLEALLLSSCFYDAVYNFDKEDLAWMDPYEQGDTVLFKSEHHMDTMFVKEAYLYNSTSRFMRNEASSVFNANAGFECILRHGNQLIRCRYGFIKRKEDELSVYMHTHKRFYAQNQKDVHFQKVCCNGKDYDDAIVVNSSNSEINDSEKSLNNEYFIYSKSQGLLQYKYKDGEVYTLYKKTPCMKSE